MRLNRRRDVEGAFETGRRHLPRNRFWGDDDVTSIRRVRAVRDKMCFHRSTYTTGSN